MWSQQESSSCKSNMSVSTCLKSLPKRKSTNSLLSAVDGRVVITSVFVEVDVSYSSTVGNILIDVIHCIRLNTGGERCHLSHIALVPDDTLDETLASAHGEEINGGGRGLELHRCVSRLPSNLNASRAVWEGQVDTSPTGTRRHAIAFVLTYRWDRSQRHHDTF